MLLNIIDAAAKIIVIGGVGYFIGSYIQKKRFIRIKKNIIRKAILEMEAKFMNELLKVIIDETADSLQKEES